MTTSKSDITSSGRRNAKQCDGADITELELQELDVETIEVSASTGVDVNSVKEEPKRGRGRPPKKKRKQSVSNKNKTSSTESPESCRRSIEGEGKESDNNLSDVDKGRQPKVGQGKKRGRLPSSVVPSSRSSPPPKILPKSTEEIPKINTNKKQSYRVRNLRKRDRQALSDDDDHDDNNKSVSDDSPLGKQSKPSVDIEQPKRKIQKTKEPKQAVKKLLMKETHTENVPKSNLGHKVFRRKPPNKKNEVDKPTSLEETSKKKFGPKEERTCPHCNVVMSSLHGLAYHIKHQVCRREDEEAKAFLFVKKKGNGEAPFPPIRPGASFLTVFGVVEVIQDDRLPDDYGTTLVGPKEKQQAKLLKEKQQKKKSKIKSQGLSQNKALSQYHLLHKSMLRQLYHYKDYSCCISSQSMPTNHCFSYAAICARFNQQEQKQQRHSDQNDTRKGNILEPVDSYPDRIVECFLRLDIRQRIYGEEENDDDSKLTKADVAKQAIQQAQFEATNRSDSLSYEQHAESTSKYNESKIFIQRRLLHTLYNPNIPVYICPLCGQQFHSSVGHKGHLTSKVCQRKKIKEEDEQDHQVVKGGTPTKKNERDVAVHVSSKGRPIRKLIDKSIASVVEDSDADSCPRQNITRKSDTKAVNSSFIQFDPSVSTVYPSVVQSLLGPVLSTGEEVRIQRRRRGVNMALVHIDGLKPKQDVERITEKKEIKSLQKQETVPMDEYSACSSSSSTTFTSENKKNLLKGNSNKPTLSSATIDTVPSRSKRISNHQGSYIPKVCENFLDVIRVMDSGRFPSMTRYYGAHADDCCVPYCKNLGKTLYCCEFCSNASHFECLQKKVVVRDWNPEGDFVCHICLRTVLSRMARHERRMEKKKQLLAAEKQKKFVLPTVTQLKSVNPYKFDPAKTALYPEVYEALGFLRKGAKVNIKEKSVKQRKRMKKKRTLDTERNEEIVEVKRVPVDTKQEDNILEVSEQSTGATIIDTLVLAEEIRNGRYPSMNLYNGPHEEICLICKKDGNDEEQENTEQQLYYCDFCNKAEHMCCLKSRVKIREIDPETDDFMCHRCILTVVARRVRAERRRLQKREEALEKAGIGRNNPFYQINSAAPSASVSVEREVSFEKMAEFDSHVTTFDSCPNGGLGGLICCQQCEGAYSRFLSDTAKEIESQTVSIVGREVSEMLELLEDAKLRLQQALEASEANDFRRSMCNSTF